MHCGSRGGRRSRTRPDLEAGGAAVHEEARDALLRPACGLLLAGGDEHDDEVGEVRVGDEVLGAVHDPVVAVGRAHCMPRTSEPAPGSVKHCMPRFVGARAGLGHRRAASKQHLAEVATAPRGTDRAPSRRSPAALWLLVSPFMFAPLPVITTHTAIPSISHGSPGDTRHVRQHGRELQSSSTALAMRLQRPSGLLKIGQGLRDLSMPEF